MCVFLSPSSCQPDPPPRNDILIDCAVFLSYLTPELSVNHAVRKEPIKLKVGLYRAGGSEKETGSLSPEMESIVVLQLMKKPLFEEKTYKT